MILNGFFVEDHWQERSEGGSLGEGKIIIGYDPGKKAYVDYMISNDGQTGSTTSTVNGSVWTGTGSQTDSSGKVYRTRHVRTVSSDGRTVTIKAEYSADRGKPWLRWWEQVGRKVN